jgi:4-hydroxythreonine-4-phosphate dehydrogenase
VLKKIKVMEESLKVDFGIEKPNIAILGVNPHAGDEGNIGDEEEKIIRPAIIESKKSGILVSGPYSADGFFGSGNFKKFDGILATYHDQGLIALKALSFGEGVNYTAGLGVIRTSPDHGTGYEIAGQNLADESSFRKALFLAKDIAVQKFDYHDSRANALVVKKSKTTYNEEEDEILEETN